MKKFVLLVTLALLSACGVSRSGAEKAVRENLKDPDSARFGDFYYNDKTHKGCLAVNAKNSMGGYTGYQLASLEKTENGWEVFGINEVSFDFCRNNYAD